MTPTHTFTDEQVVAIVFGIALGSASRPRHDISSYLTQSMGELGGYVAGIAVMAFIGALVGVIVHGVFKRINGNRRSRQLMQE